MSDSHHHKLDKLTPELMEGYVNGTLSPDMLQKVEEFLAENPFEAEAIEGLKFRSGQLSKDLNELESRLSERVQPGTKKPAWYVWSAAAVALVLLSGLAVYLLLPNEPVNPPVAVKQEPVPSVEVEPVPPNNDNALFQPELPIETRDTDIPVKSESGSPVLQESSNDRLKSIAGESPSPDDKDRDFEINLDQIEGKNPARESLMVEETAPLERSILLNNRDDNKKSAARSAAPAVQQYQHQFNGLPGAHPPPDWNEYLSRSLRYPEAARTEKIRGSVKITFRVNTDGSLSNLEVVQELGFGCDQEAIRVLEHGPAWKPAMVNNIPVISTGEIEISFPPDQ